MNKFDVSLLVCICVCDKIRLKRDFAATNKLQTTGTL